MPAEIETINWEILWPYDWHFRMPDTLRDLTDIWVIGILLLTGGMLGWAIFRAFQAVKLTKKYRALAAKLEFEESPRELCLEFSEQKGLPLAKEFANELLVEVPVIGSPLEKKIKRCGSAAEVFNSDTLAQGVVGSRLLMATPAILTGLGVLGTFVGLAMGIGGLDLDSKNIEDLDKSISPLIKGSSTAFVTSVWGVLASILFTIAEKNLEGFAIKKIRGLQAALNLAIPRYTPEESMIALQGSSGEQKEILNGLAVAIGEQMQSAMDRVGEGITKAVKEALGGQAQDLGKMSADLMSEALTNELANLQQAVTSMSDGFKEEFGAASDKLSNTVAGFDSVLRGVDECVKTSRDAMNDAVGRLTAHEDVVVGLKKGATQLEEAARNLALMKETFSQSAEQNLSAATAQEKAAATNENVAEKLSTIGEKLPEIQEAVADGAQVIASIGQPLLDLKESLEKTPKIFEEQEQNQASRDEQRSNLLLAQTEKLVETIGDAAKKIAGIESLAADLSSAALSLKGASDGASGLFKNINLAAEQHLKAAESSERAANAGERAANKLEPIPDSLAEMSETLKSAGGKIKEGADSAQEVYRELLSHQKLWFEGIENGLEVMRERVQEILEQYGESVDGNTRNLMEVWTTEVNESVGKFSAQIQILEGAMSELTDEMNR